MEMEHYSVFLCLFIISLIEHKNKAERTSRRTRKYIQNVEDLSGEISND